VYAQNFDPVAFAMMKKYAKYVWVTDDVLANQWDAFPTYMSTIFAACKPTSSAVNKLTSIIAPVSIPADTNEDTLHTYTLPANSLAVNGQSVRVTMWGTFANNAHNKTVRVYFGATAFAFPATALAVAAHTWTVDMVVTRLTATTQAAKARYQDTSGVSEVVAVNLVASPAETLSGNIVIRNTGQITATPTAGDIIATATVVELMP
jgi:hypothetical protein